MKVTYLNHSGFLLEWENSYWIFDYYKGHIPNLNPQKDILVFCSHSHEDHFNPDIFKLFGSHPSVSYIFSNEIREYCQKLNKKNKQALPDILFLKNQTDTVFTTKSGESLFIHTLRSTDYGCAFYIEYKEKVIYHAGDLHWWYWEGEDADWNKNMTADYKKEMKYLEKRTIDLAFTVLDPRQEKDYALGMNHFLNSTHTLHMFPMHFGDDFNIINKYLQKYPIPAHTTFHALQENGQDFEVMI